MQNFKTIIFTLFVAIALVGCGGADERKAAYFEKARNSYEAGEFEKAKVNLKNVLQIDPKHSGATYLMGSIAEKKKDYKKAFNLYSKAIELDSNNLKARYSLGKFYLQLTEKEKAQDQVTSIESASPGNDLAKSLKAAIFFNETKYDDAISILNDVQKKNRGEDVYVLLAAAYYKSGNANKAIATLNEGVQHHTKSLQLRVILAETYIEQENKEAAIKNLREIINMSPDNLVSYIRLARYYEKLGDSESAKDVYRNLVDSDPENKDYQLLMVQYTAAKSGEAEAINYLKRLTIEYPDVDEYAIVYSRFELKVGNKEKSITILEDVINRQSTDKGVNAAKNQLALIKASEGNMTDASKLLNEILEKNPTDVAANLALGKILLKENKPDDAVVPLRVVVHESPENGTAYVLLAQAHRLLGENDLANDVITRGFQEVPGNQTLSNIYIKQLMDKGANEKALSIIENMPVVSGDTISANTNYLKANVYLANRKFTQAAKLGEELVENYPDKELGYRIMASVYAKQNLTKKSVDTLKKGLIASNSATLLIAYANAQAQLGEVDEAISFLKNFTKYKPLTSTLLAELYALKKDFPSSEKYYRQAISLNPEWDAPYLALATLQYKRGNPGKAIETYKSALDKVKNNNKIRFMMATMYHQQGNVEKTIDMYRSVIDDNPDNLIAINNLAQILVDNYNDQASLNEALKLVEKIKENKSLDIRDTVGWVYYKSKKYTEAVEVLKSVINESPDIPIFNYHLGMVYLEIGNTAKAKQYLKKSAEAGTDFSGKDIAVKELSKLQ